MQPLRLEVFTAEDEAAFCTREAEAEPQDQPFYDMGYQEGWAEAMAARDAEADSEAAEVMRTLQALEFTFHDARAHVLRALAPVFEELTARILPKIALESLPYLLREVLLPFAEEASFTPVELLIHPEMRETVARHLSVLPALPLVLVDEPEQPRARISMRSGERETRIDAQAALDAIDTLLHSYFAPPAQEARHG